MTRIDKSNSNSTQLVGVHKTTPMPAAKELTQTVSALSEIPVLPPPPITQINVELPSVPVFQKLQTVKVTPASLDMLKQELRAVKDEVSGVQVLKKLYQAIQSEKGKRVSPLGIPLSSHINLSINDAYDIGKCLGTNTVLVGLMAKLDDIFKDIDILGNPSIEAVAERKDYFREIIGELVRQVVNPTIPKLSIDEAMMNKYHELIKYIADFGVIGKVTNSNDPAIKEKDCLFICDWSQEGFSNSIDMAETLNAIILLTKWMKSKGNYPEELSKLKQNFKLMASSVIAMRVDSEYLIASRVVYDKVTKELRIPQAQDINSAVDTDLLIAAAFIEGSLLFDSKEDTAEAKKYGEEAKKMLSRIKSRELIYFNNTISDGNPMESGKILLNISEDVQPQTPLNHGFWTTNSLSIMHYAHVFAQFDPENKDLWYKIRKDSFETAYEILKNDKFLLEQYQLYFDDQGNFQHEKLFDRTSPKILTTSPTFLSFLMRESVDSDTNRVGLDPKYQIKQEDLKEFIRLYVQINVEHTTVDAKPVYSTLSTDVAVVIPIIIEGQAPGSAIQIPTTEYKLLNNTTKEFTQSSHGTILDLYGKLLINDTHPIAAFLPKDKLVDQPLESLVYRDRVGSTAYHYQNILAMVDQVLAGKKEITLEQAKQLYEHLLLMVLSSIRVNDTKSQQQYLKIVKDSGNGLFEVIKNNSFLNHYPDASKMVTDNIINPLKKMQKQTEPLMKDAIENIKNNYIFFGAKGEVSILPGSVWEKLRMLWSSDSQTMKIAMKSQQEEAEKNLRSLYDSPAINSRGKSMITAYAATSAANTAQKPSLTYKKAMEYLSQVKPQNQDDYLRMAKMIESLEGSVSELYLFSQLPEIYDKLMKLNPSPLIELAQIKVMNNLAFKNDVWGERMNFYRETINQCIDLYYKNIAGQNDPTLALPQTVYDTLTQSLLEELGKALIGLDARREFTDLELKLMENGYGLLQPDQSLNFLAQRQPTSILSDQKFSASINVAEKLETKLSSFLDNLSVSTQVKLSAFRMTCARTFLENYKDNRIVINADDIFKLHHIFQQSTYSYINQLINNADRLDYNKLFLSVSGLLNSYRNEMTDIFEKYGRPCPADLDEKAMDLYNRAELYNAEKLVQFLSRLSDELPNDIQSDPKKIELFHVIRQLFTDRIAFNHPEESAELFFTRAKFFVKGGFSDRKEVPLSFRVQVQLALKMDAIYSLFARQAFVSNADPVKKAEEYTAIDTEIETRLKELENYSIDQSFQIDVNTKRMFRALKLRQLFLKIRIDTTKEEKIKHVKEAYAFIGNIEKASDSKNGKIGFYDVYNEGQIRELYIQFFQLFTETVYSDDDLVDPVLSDLVITGLDRAAKDAKRDNRPLEEKWIEWQKAIVWRAMYYRYLDKDYITKNVTDLASQLGENQRVYAGNSGWFDKSENKVNLSSNEDFDRMNEALKSRIQVLDKLKTLSFKNSVQTYDTVTYDAYSMQAALELINIDEVTKSAIEKFPFFTRNANIWKNNYLLFGGDGGTPSPNNNIPEFIPVVDKSDSVERQMATAWHNLSRILLKNNEFVSLAPDEKEMVQNAIGVLIRQSLKFAGFSKIKKEMTNDYKKLAKFLFDILHLENIAKDVTGSLGTTAKSTLLNDLASIKGTISNDMVYNLLEKLVANQEAIKVDLGKKKIVQIDFALYNAQLALSDGKKDQAIKTLQAVFDVKADRLYNETIDLPKVMKMMGSYVRPKDQAVRYKLVDVLSFIRYLSDAKSY